MKALKIILAFSLIFSTGCSSLKVAGQNFYPENQTEELVRLLDNGVGKLTKNQLKNVILAKPETVINGNSEIWRYKNSKTQIRLKIQILASSQTENFSAKELTLHFNKNGILTSYELKEYAGQNNDQTGYGYKVGESIMIGMISGLFIGLINKLF